MRAEEAEPDELYARLRAYEGRPAAIGRRAKDPVNTPMIRHWCEALGHPVPADGTAPETMLQVWTMSGLSGASPDRDPEPGSGAGSGAGSGSAAGVGRTGAYEALLGALDEAGCTSVVATDCEQEYLRPLRPGDQLVFDAVIESVSPRKTTRLGTGYFVTTRMDVRIEGAQDVAGAEGAEGPGPEHGGVLAGTHRFRILKYAPARRGSAAGTEDRPAAAAVPAPVRPRPAQRPRPVVNRDNAGFWEGVARHRLLVQRCDECATLRFPWLPGCNACGSQRWTPVESAGRGTVYSYVVMHHPPFPAFDPPYAVALVELAEGVRMLGNVTGVPYDEVRIGLPVEVEFREVGSGDGSGDGAGGGESGSGAGTVLPFFRAGRG